MISPKNNPGVGDRWGAGERGTSREYNGGGSIYQPHDGAVEVSPSPLCGSTPRLRSTSVESPPTLLATNRLVHARRLSLAPRTVRKHDDGFDLEGHW